MELRILFLKKSFMPLNLSCRLILDISEISVAWQGIIFYSFCCFTSGLLNSVCRCIKQKLAVIVDCRTPVFNSNGVCFIVVCTGEANDQSSRGAPETTLCSERRD